MWRRHAYREAVTRLRSGPLAAWANAWLAGQVAFDDVLRAVTGDDAPHRVVGLEAEAEGVPLSAALIHWRRVGGPVRLVLPVAGDLRGVPGPAAFRVEAVAVGEAVIGGGIGLVPEVIDHSPSSARPSVTWQATPTEPAPADVESVADAQYELASVVRESAAALAAADVAGSPADLGPGLHEARRAGENLNLPPGFAPRAVALLAQAERLHAMLALAGADPAGGAIDRMGAAAREAALRPLAIAVRRARLAGYNAGAN